MKKLPLTFVFIIITSFISFAQTWNAYNTSNSDIPFNKIHSMCLDVDGKVWMGNDVSGNFNHLASFDGSFWNGVFNNNWINSVCSNQSGRVWASSWGNIEMWDGIGWNTIIPSGVNLSYWASPMCVQDNGVIWILNETELLKFDGSQWEAFTPANSDLASINISSIQSFDNKVYVSTTDMGIGIYDGSGWQFYNTSNSNLSDNLVLCLNVKDEIIWSILGNGELARFENGSFTFYSNTNLTSATDISIGNNNEIWIATNGSGLIHFSNSDFVQHLYSQNNTLDIYDQYLCIELDADNNLWAGSRSSGLIHFSQESIATQINPGDSIKVFFLGNSFTNANNMPEMVAQLAEEANQNYFIDAYAPGGQFSTDHCQNPQVYEMLKNTDWDFVIIQDNQGAFVGNVPSVSSTYIDANQQLVDSIHAYNPCTRTLLFAGWAGEGGYPTYFPGDNTISCIGRILDNVNYLNTMIDEVVAPIGEGWIQCLNEQPGINLYSSDLVHPSEAGSFITANILFSMIFKMNPLSLSYNGGLSNTDADYIQQMAFDIVSDPINMTNYAISTIVPEIAIDSSIIFSLNEYAGYQWIFENTQVPNSDNDTIDYINAGIYELYTIDNQGCQYHSFDLEMGLLPIPLFTYVLNGDSVTFTELCQNHNFINWNFGDGTTSTEANPIHHFQQSGTYLVVLTAGNSFTSSSYSEEITITLSDEIIDQELISVYPNPADDFIKLHFPGTTTFTLLDASGKMIMEDEINEDYLLSIKNLKPGTYWIKWGQQASSKFIKI